jgi:uncharacterized protein (TIGR02594 family)
MRFKTRVLLAVGCVSLLATSIPALSIPAPRGFAYQHRNFHKKKIAQHVPAGHAKPHAARENHAVRLVSTPIAEPPKRPMFGWPALVREARKYIGTNPTARTKLWCATFMNLMLAKLGYAGTNSDAAKSFADYGHRISEPEIGAIAVLSRGKTGGHVGVVSGIDSHGNPIIISGNHGHRVGEAVYSRARVIAYVMPSERRPLSDTQVAERATPIAPSKPSAQSTLSAPNRAPSEPSIDSPITELVATIETEQNHSQAYARPARPPEPPPRHSVQRMPERAQQNVRQVAQRPSPRAVVPARRELRRDLPLDPRLAGLFGIKARASVEPPPRLAPQRQQPVQQRGRVASANIGLAVRQSVPR